MSRPSWNARCLWPPSISQLRKWNPDRKHLCVTLIQKQHPRRRPCSAARVGCGHRAAGSSHSCLQPHAADGSACTALMQRHPCAPLSSRTPGGHARLTHGAQQHRYSTALLYSQAFLPAAQWLQLESPPGCAAAYSDRLMLRQIFFFLQSSHKTVRWCSSAEFNFTVQLGPWLHCQIQINVHLTNMDQGLLASSQQQ